MATGLNLGSFASGFAQGFGDSQKLRLAGEAAQREQERLGFEKQRLEMEAQNQARQAELHALSVREKAQQIGEMERKEASRKALAEKMGKLAKDLNASYESDVYDARTGTIVGTQRYNDPNEVVGQLMSEGKRLGPRRAVQPVDEQEKLKRIIMLQHQHNLENGDISMDDFSKMADNYRQWGGQAIEKGMKHMLTTGDEAGAKKILEEGGIKLGPNDRIKLEVDPKTGTADVVMGTIGKNGKFQKKYGMMDFYAQTVDPAGYAKIVEERKKTALQEAGMDRRTAMQGQFAMDRTVYEQGAANAREVQKATAEALKNRPEEIRKWTQDHISKYISNPNAQYNANAVFEYGGMIADGMERLVNQGVPHAQAFNKTIKWLKDKGYEPVPLPK